MDLFSRFRKPKANLRPQSPSQQMINVNTNSLMNHYSATKYSSAYPNIRAIADEYITIMPRAIDDNGKTIQNNNIINALYHPNQKDDIVSFNEKIAVSTLFNSNTYLLVWSRSDGGSVPGGDFGRLGVNISGFTFLENPSLTRRDGKTYYSIGANEFSEDEVITLPGGVDPTDLYAGYSPSVAAIRWLKLSDLIADFQTGFFDNNAIAAGMYIITGTVTEFDDISDMIQGRHGGAGNNNKPTFSHRPIDKSTGKPAAPQIEWIPFQQSQKDVDFSALFDQVNRGIDMSYGVSQIIKGVDDQAKYSNADVSERGFAKRVVFPRALKNYSRLTHELNRITGGIGMAITFDYVIPSVADKDKVEAEVRQININVMTLLIDKGYSLDSVVDTLKLPDNYKLLKTGTGAATIENDKPQVDDGGEVDSAPDPDLIDGTGILGEAKHRPKAEASDYDRVLVISQNYMRATIDRAIDELGNDTLAAVETTEEDDLKTFADEALLVLIGSMIASGEIEYGVGVELLKSKGLATESIDKFILKDIAKDDYLAHLNRVGGSSYNAETKLAIQKVLADAREQGLSQNETRDNLAGLFDKQKWRAERLARSEISRSQNLGSVEAMTQLKAETAASIEKTISHPSGAGCPQCRAMEGVWVAVDQPMLALNDSVTDENGVIYVNNFETNNGTDYHPNGTGSPRFRISDNV